jgi:hypothetical protein
MAAPTLHDPANDGTRTKIKFLYLSGPMTGIPQCSYPLFNEVAVKLRDAGFVVINPAELTLPKPGSYVDLLRRDFEALLQCDGVALLPGWANSRGATTEVHVAELLKMPVKLWDLWTGVNDGIRKVSDAAVRDA